jgi:hypothetical protein
MRIALICPSNLLYMPYVSNFERILEASAVEYEVINWDRFHIEDNHPLKYRDSKIGHRRNVLDYYKFSVFISEKLKLNNYDKVIVFGMQVAFFIKSILLNNYNGKYILDIRDYNKIMRFFNIKETIDNSSFTVISSPGYKEWLPESNKYIINHNTQVSCLEDLEEINIDFKKEKLDLANIGAIRDYSINIKLINSLRNSNAFNMYFHGEGSINKNISRHLKINNIKNVYLTGRYKNEDEISLYKQSDLINLLVPNNHINSRTLLPNRLYNAALFGKPVIAFEKTYLAEQIKKYSLGITLNSFNNVEEKICSYLKYLSIDEYNQGRKSFFKNVIRDNELFRMYMGEFINI